MITKTGLVTLLVLTGCASVPVADPTIAFDFDNTAFQHPEIRLCVDRVRELGGYGKLPWERAAFLILRPDGHFECREWPVAFQFLQAKWSDSIPDGTIAVLHSHPDNLPNPSKHDQGEAVRIGVPVFVISGSAIFMAKPRGGGVAAVSLESPRKPETELARSDH